MKLINRNDAVSKIHATKGRVFGVKFIKRTTGELREGRFRLGYTVQKGLVGGELRYSPSEKGLITAYRMAGDQSVSEGERRMIPIEGITEITVDGESFSVR